MMANGFLPDTISSDIHTLCIDGPAFDQVTTLSKFLCLGMDLNDVIAATTVNAAAAIRRPEYGSLRPGSLGDATILTVDKGAFDYVDVTGEHLTGDKRIFSHAVVLRGEWWHEREAGRFASIGKKEKA
jgi:dihydroorotase